MTNSETYDAASKVAREALHAAFAEGNPADKAFGITRQAAEDFILWLNVSQPQSINGLGRSNVIRNATDDVIHAWEDEQADAKRGVYRFDCDKCGGPIFANDRNSVARICVKCEREAKAEQEAADYDYTAREAYHSLRDGREFPNGICSCPE
jgi:hypothetical protein